MYSKEAMLKYNKSHKGHVNRIMCRIADRSRNENVALDVDREYLSFLVKNTKYCPILNIKLQRNTRALYNSYSIDRIDPKKGYVNNNIQIISYKANTMKSDANKKELKAFASWIINNIK